MLDSVFYVQTLFCFIFMALASYAVFFARTFKILVVASALTLLAITFQFLFFDIFRFSVSGRVVVFFLWFFFLFEIVLFNFFINTKIKKTLLIYPLAFLAFITMAISVDLLTFLFGFVLFSLSFVGLFSFRGRDKRELLATEKNFLISFLTFVYGMLLLYVREATLQTKDLYLKLKMSLNSENYDELIILGFSFFLLSVLIELYAIFPLLGKKR
ncbi:MAG: hypothetical protein E7013_04440 [Alphaproteobacteria bacterium]|nr:hypothetical protein [Alphaproteobacteria bacterium]